MRYEDHSFKFAEEILNSKLQEKREIEEVIRSICVPPGKVQAKWLNSQFKEELIRRDWESHPAIADELGLKADFRKSRIQVEIQFGNVARYYADILKFQLAYLEDIADVGVLIVPKQSLSRHIGDNIAYYERATREVERLKLALPLPVWVIGVER